MTFITCSVLLTLFVCGSGKSGTNRTDDEMVVGLHAELARKMVKSAKRAQHSQGRMQDADKKTGRNIATNGKGAARKETHQSRTGKAPTTKLIRR